MLILEDLPQKALLLAGHWGTCALLGSMRTDGMEKVVRKCGPRLGFRP